MILEVDPKLLTHRFLMEPFQEPLLTPKFLIEPSMEPLLTSFK